MLHVDLKGLKIIIIIKKDRHDLLAFMISIWCYQSIMSKSNLAPSPSRMFLFAYSWKTWYFLCHFWRWTIPSNLDIVLHYTFLCSAEKQNKKNHTGFKHESCILGDKKTKHNAVWFMMGEMVLNRRQTSNFFIAMPCFTSGVYRNHTQSSASTWLFGLIRYRCIEQCCTTVQWYSSHSVLIPSVSPL